MSEQYHSGYEPVDEQPERSVRLDRRRLLTMGGGALALASVGVYGLDRYEQRQEPELDAYDAFLIGDVSHLKAAEDKLLRGEVYRAEFSKEQTAELVKHVTLLNVTKWYKEHDINSVAVRIDESDVSTPEHSDDDALDVIVKVEVQRLLGLRKLAGPQSDMFDHEYVVGTRFVNGRKKRLPEHDLETPALESANTIVREWVDSPHPNVSDFLGDEEEDSVESVLWNTVNNFEMSLRDAAEPLQEKLGEDRLIVIAGIHDDALSVAFTTDTLLAHEAKRHEKRYEIKSDDAPRLSDRLTRISDSLMSPAMHRRLELANLSSSDYLKQAAEENRFKKRAERTDHGRKKTVCLAFEGRDIDEDVDLYFSWLENKTDPKVISSSEIGFYLNDSMQLAPKPERPRSEPLSESMSVRIIRAIADDPTITEEDLLMRDDYIVASPLINDQIVSCKVNPNNGQVILSTHMS